MSGTGSIILTIVLALVVVLGSAVLIRRPAAGGEDRDLRRRFGPEYDRVAARRGDPAAARRELAERVRAHDALTLRPLTPQERDRFERTWTTVQERFIDDPRGAAAQADQLIGGLLTALGYPSEDRERQLELASVDHAHALGDYWRARELVHRGLDGDGAAARMSPAAEAAATVRAGGSESTREAIDGASRNASSAGPLTRGARDGDAVSSTETLRQAVLHYRVMFDALLGHVDAERAYAGQH